jgi:hypothetical protein
MALFRHLPKLVMVYVTMFQLCRADDLDQAFRLILPVIHARAEDKLAAMKSASTIVVAQVRETRLSSTFREVEKPLEVGGPMVPVIPLYLAKIAARPLLTIRGKAPPALEFFSWVWASGKHGGPRLFNAAPDYVHVFFLKEDSGFLHSVGDYPAYDLEIRSRWVPSFITNWNAGYGQGGDVMERIVAVRLKAELENIGESEGREYWLNTLELAGLTSRSFVAGYLNVLCNQLANPAGKAKACAAFTDEVRSMALQPQLE